MFSGLIKVGKSSEEGEVEGVKVGVGESSEGSDDEVILHAFHSSTLRSFKG